MKFFTLPNLLSGLRLTLVPLLLALAWTNLPSLFFPFLILAMLTDMADGYLARKLQQTSEFGAMLDSWADLLTYLSLPFCVWWLRPDVIREEKNFLAAAVFCYLSAIGFGFLKFRRLTAYHTWSGKLAAILMGGVAVALFGGAPGWLLRVAVPVVVLNALEEIAITATLSALRTDVPSLWHAIQIHRSPAENHGLTQMDTDRKKL